uniref:PRKCSH domain-containing protein n=1 Tax=Heterorhabditis bacteriophora TaxID=37862 RepID=A0A1I7WC67_HETBA
MLLFLLLTCKQVIIAWSHAGIYNIEEVRDITYDVDISSLPAGIDAYVDLSLLSEENMLEIQEQIMERVPKVTSLVVMHKRTKFFLKFQSDDPSYLFMTSKTGQRFACSLPQSDAKSNGVPESFNPKYLAEIVAASFYVKECIQKVHYSYFNMGWWTYEICRGRIIRQLHGAKNEADQVENSLGMFTGRYSMPDFQTSTPDQLLYFEEWYEGGTMCDLPDKEIPRKTSVRYQCDPLLATNEAYIDSVYEQSSCEYIFVVNVGSLCKLKPFVHPNQERVKKYLKEIIEKKKSKESARDRLFHAMDKVKRIQRRRTAMRRTELLKDGEVKKLKLRKELDNEYFNAATKYLADAYEARKGIVPPADTVQALAQLSTMMDDIDLAYCMFLFSKFIIVIETGIFFHLDDYPSDLDEDRGNIWYYFNDPTWNKSHFPKSLDYVDIMNAYFDTALEQLQKFHPTEVVREYNLLRKNPWNPDENILVDSLDVSFAMLILFIISIPYACKFGRCELADPGKDF